MKFCLNASFHLHKRRNICLNKNVSKKSVEIKKYGSLLKGKGPLGGVWIKLPTSP